MILNSGGHFEPFLTHTKITVLIDMVILSMLTPAYFSIVFSKGANTCMEDLLTACK